MKIFALLLVLFSQIEAVELGAGFNEQLAAIYNPLIVKSQSRWARAYVNVTRNYMTYANPVNTPPPNPINGYLEGNIYQYPAHVSSDVDVLAIASLDNLIFTKTQNVHGEPVKIIFSLKHDFTYPYKNEAPYGIVPDTQSERQLLFDAIQGILETNSRGQYIDILVLGNEPMFEMQPNTDPATATKYIDYLDFLIPKLTALKATNGWTFAIYIGALNHPSAPAPADNTILPAVLSYLQQHPDSVDGIDLHEHVMDPCTVLQDIQLVKQYLQPNQKIISTEFSLILLWDAHQNDTLGAWGTRHGFPANWKLYEWLNYVITQASLGQPVSKKLFMSYFNEQPWYPKHWFRSMIDIFKKEGVYAVTYGLEESPIYPWSHNLLSGQSLPWVLNGVYNGTLFGTSKCGYYRTNPLVYPDFLRAAKT